MDSARTITLTIMQRFGLEDLLGSQKSKREAATVFYKIRKKIKVSLAERRDWTERGIIIQHLTQQGTQIAIDEERAAQIAPLEVWLESEEVRRLRKLGDEVEVTPAILDWLEPLMEQLEAKDPPAALRVLEATDKSA
jgi:hypothetical protein